MNQNYSYILHSNGSKFFIHFHYVTNMMITLSLISLKLGSFQNLSTFTNSEQVPERVSWNWLFQVPFLKLKRDKMKKLFLLEGNNYNRKILMIDIFCWNFWSQNLNELEITLRNQNVKKKQIPKGVDERIQSFPL